MSNTPPPSPQIPNTENFRFEYPYGVVSRNSTVVSFNSKELQFMRPWKTGLWPQEAYEKCENVCVCYIYINWV